MADEKLQKHLINLYEGDYKKLGELYPLPPGELIRRLVRRAIKVADKPVKVDPLEEINLNE